jgi:hypothetical protein
VLEGSDDGSVWTRLGDETTATPTPVEDPAELSRLMLRGDSFRYVRVTIRAGRWLGVCELRVFQ